MAKVSATDRWRQLQIFPEFWHVLVADESLGDSFSLRKHVLTCWGAVLLVVPNHLSEYSDLLKPITIHDDKLLLANKSMFFWVIPVLLRYEVCFPSMFFTPPVGFYASWLFGWLVQCRLCFGFPAALIYLLVKPATQSGSPKSRSGLLKNCLITKLVHCQFDFLNPFCNLLLSSLENNTTWIHGAVCAAKRQMTVCLKKTR